MSTVSSQRRFARCGVVGAAPRALLLSLFYMYVVLTFWFLPRRGMLTDFLTLPGVYRLFSNSGLLLSGWIDLIAMDLVVGAWMTRKAVQTDMPRFLLIPCLVLTFIFAGFGFPAFAIAAAIAGRWSGISDVEQVPAVESQPVVAVLER